MKKKMVYEGLRLFKEEGVRRYHKGVGQSQKGVWWCQKGGVWCKKCVRLCPEGVREMSVGWIGQTNRLTENFLYIQRSCMT